jgi:tRNA(Ile)-lysidine synthase
MMPIEETGSSFFVVENLPTTIILPDGKSFSIDAPAPYESANGIPSGPANKAWLDGDTLQLPFIVRQWKQGDYFYPLGMSRKKKVARFLFDQKVSPVEKQNVWVLESGKRICWVVGYRMDDRFKLRTQTKKVIRVTVK